MVVHVDQDQLVSPEEVSTGFSFSLGQIHGCLHKQQKDPVGPPL